MSFLNPDETVEERHIRVDEILKRNSQPLVCDFCTRKSMKRMTNIGDNVEVILACDRCIREKRLLT